MMPCSPSSSQHAVDFAVDDDPSVVESYSGLRVEPFEGDPWDEELLRVPEAVDASED